MVKDHFVYYCVQSEGIFQTIPEWAKFRVKDTGEKGKKPSHVDRKIAMKILFHYPPTFPFVKS